MISPLKKTIINLPIRLRGNSKRTSSNSLSLVAEGSNKDLGAVSQTLLAKVRLRLRGKLWLGRPDGTFLESCYHKVKSSTNKQNISTSWNLNEQQKNDVGFFLIGRAIRVSGVAISESHIRGPRCHSPWRRSTDTYWFVSDVWLAEVSRFPRHYWEGMFLQFLFLVFCFFFFFLSSRVHVMSFKTKHLDRFPITRNSIWYLVSERIQLHSIEITLEHH